MVWCRTSDMVVFTSIFTRASPEVMDVIRPSECARGTLGRDQALQQPQFSGEAELVLSTTQAEGIDPNEVPPARNTFCDGLADRHSAIVNSYDDGAKECVEVPE